MHNSPLRNLLIVLAALVTGMADAKPSPEFVQHSEFTKWFENLMQPDFPHTSCCGHADAYWSDAFVVDASGQTWAIITDDRGEDWDSKARRIHRDPGTKWLVPDYKLKYDQGNPTGHGVVFLSTNGSVICYVTPGGV
jgi:hypothetical protein